MNFPSTICCPVSNHLTARTYALIRASDLEPTPATLGRITRICNEPDVYDWIFRNSLKGEPYPELKARQWLASASDGWNGKTHFVFAVVDEHREVAAACDIKSCDGIPEIGYWSSQHHRGIMTNTVRAMCTLAKGAGLKGLFARTRIGNARSQAVLQRTGFQTSQIDRPDRLKYVLKFDT